MHHSARLKWSMFGCYTLDLWHIMGFLIFGHNAEEAITKTVLCVTNRVWHSALLYSVENTTQDKSCNQLVLSVSAYIKLILFRIHMRALLTEFQSPTWTVENGQVSQCSAHKMKN